ncbi:MAG: acyltransferase [Prevotella sp.]|nr:acyltransferase [Prevotella sp.]
MKKTRDSNMELLRIVAMLLIMVVHANFRALPKPDAVAIAAEPTSAFLQFLTEGFSIVGVNVFVMISGWYGIRPRLVRFTELLFQVVFFGVLCVAIEYAITGALPPRSIPTILLLDASAYWFVKVYIALYLFAPVLNAFVEHATKEQFERVLLCVFGFMFVFGWLSEATTWIGSGYSLPWFMCLYLLARYMRVHQPWFTQFRPTTDLGIYLTVVAFLAVAVFIMRHYNVGGVLYFYCCPVVVVGAMYLLLFFSKLTIRSQAINWVAISALSIYLTHSNSYLGQYYDEQIRQWFYGESRLAFIVYAALMIAGVFMASILLDKLRLLLWHPVEKFLETKQKK